jgi:hypothetical protein
MANKQYTEAFKTEAVKQITERGHAVAVATARLGVTTTARNQCTVSPGWRVIGLLALLAMGAALLFNVWTARMLLSPDGQLEWPHTLHVWLIQGVALTVGAISGVAYLCRTSICRVWRQLSPTGQALALLGVLVTLEILLGTGYWWTSEHPRFSDWGYLYNLFHLNLEFNLPSFFSVAQFWLAACIAWLCYPYAVRQARQTAYAWLTAALMLLALGIDELLSFHEDAERLLVKSGLLHASYDNRMGGYGYAWTLVGLPLALIFGAWFAWQFFRVFRHRKTQLVLLVLAGLIFITGSVGMENLQVYARDHYALSRPPKEILLAEEMMEMFAVSLAIFVFYRHLREQAEQESPVRPG